MARRQAITGFVKQLADQKRDLLSATSALASFFAEAFADRTAYQLILQRIPKVSQPSRCWLGASTIRIAKIWCIGTQLSEPPAKLVGNHDKSIE